MFGPRLGRVAIAELAEDRVVEGVYAVAKKERRRTKGGSPYLALELVDPSGRIDARVWKDVELLDARFAEGDAVRVLGRVERFRDRLQLDVRSLEAVEDEDPAEFAPAMRRDADELDGFLEFLAGEIAHPGLRATGAVLEDNELRGRCAGCPAAGDSPLVRRRAARAHRRRGDALPRDSAATPAACCDLVLAAALLHDVGRTPSWRAGRVPRRPRRGVCSGHVHLGLRLIEERADGARDGVRAELLHAVACTTKRARAGPPRRRCSTTRTSSTPRPRRGRSDDRLRGLRRAARCRRGALAHSSTGRPIGSGRFQST